MRMLCQCYVGDLAKKEAHAFIKNSWNPLLVSERAVNGEVLRLWRLDRVLTKTVFATALAANTAVGL